MTKACILRNVSYSYPGIEWPVLSQVNLDIPEGALALLVGASGSGKSTLLRCLNGLVPHFSGGTFSGNIQSAGLDPVKVGPQVMSRRVGFVFQDPEVQFVLDRVEDEIAFALENAAIPPNVMHQRVTQVMEQLNISALRHRRLETLSGGERQRTAIASALALQPRVLVLDEPTSQLDPHSADEVLKSLVELKVNLGLTIILAEHRLERILPYADQVIYIDPHQPGVLSGEPGEILPRIPLHSPLISLGKSLGWQPLPRSIEEARLYTHILQFERSYRNNHTPVEPITLVAQKPTPILSAENLSHQYGNHTALEQVSLEVYPGEIMALMGANGAGKSTLLRCLVGLIRPDSGRIWMDGLETTRRDVSDICLNVGYLPQDPNALLFADTVLDELQITLRNHHRLPLRSGDLSPEILLERLGLADKAHLYPRDLSTGERQRVALGSIMITQPKLLLLDEPTRGLDPAAKTHLAELLRGWRSEGIATILATHDVELAANLADRVMILEAGKVIAQGPTRTVLNSSPGFMPQIAQLFPGRGWLTPQDVIDQVASHGRAG